MGHAYGHGSVPVLDAAGDVQYPHQARLVQQQFTFEIAELIPFPQVTDVVLSQGCHLRFGEETDMSGPAPVCEVKLALDQA
ncbi:hypothetical protein D3C79_1025280 [compost metagenome]